MQPLIRPLVPADHDALFELVRRFATSFQPRRDAFAASARHLGQQPDACVRVAEANGALVGYCLGFEHLTFYANGRVASLEEIMVDEPARRSGVGRALMTSFEDWARSRGAVLVGLATRRAAPFYDALGYEQSATFFRRVL